MLTAEWYFCLHSIGILNLSCFGNPPILLEAVQVPYVQPIQKISTITEYKCIKGNNARNLSSDLANPDKCLASFSADSSGSFCDMHFISSTILSCPRLILQFFFLVAWSQLFHSWTDHLLKVVEQVWEAQGAPIFCASVALVHEQTCLSCFRQFQASQIFHHRYVDNRVILLPAPHWNSELD